MKKKMRRIAWLTAAVILLNLSCCGAQQSAEDAAAESETQTQAFKTENGEKAKAVHLDADVRHCYPHMDKSYEQGYIPKIENDTVYLVLPVTADGRLKDERLFAELVMGQNAPFIYANYRKELKKETYLFETAQDAYLLCCEIGLEKQRTGGKYPVDVRVYGYTEAGERTEFAARIFITVPDGEGSGGVDSEPGAQPPAGQPAEPITELPTEPVTEPVTETPAEPATEPASEVVIEPSTEPPTEEPFTEEPFTDEPQTELLAEEPVISGGGFGGGYTGGGMEQTEKIHRQPRLMVTESAVSGARLLAGEEMPVTVSLKNTSAEETVYNLMVSLKPSQDLKLSAASFYFDRLYPQETVTLPFSIGAAANAAAGGASVSLSFAYENVQGTAYAGEDELTLDIYQPVQAAMEGFSIPALVYAQEMAESSISVRNLGKTAIYNATVELEAAGLFATGSVFAGNLEAGASYDGTMHIYVGHKNMASISDYGASDENGYGQTTGILTLTYEDADGKVCRQTQEFSTVIQKPQIVELTVQKEEEPQTNQWWAAILVAAACVFLLIVCILGWRLKKSRDALADLLAAKEGRHAY